MVAFQHHGQGLFLQRYIKETERERETRGFSCLVFRRRLAYSLPEKGGPYV